MAVIHGEEMKYGERTSNAQIDYYLHWDLSGQHLGAKIYFTSQVHCMDWCSRLGISCKPSNNDGV